jgi:hypothetical protein
VAARRIHIRVIGAVITDPLPDIDEMSQMFIYSSVYL